MMCVDLLPLVLMVAWFERFLGPGAISCGRELVRGASRADGELKAQIPWLRVFVEGVVIVGKLEN